jgi:microcystin-dependent protein
VRISANEQDLRTIWHCLREIGTVVFKRAVRQTISRVGGAGEAGMGSPFVGEIRMFAGNFAPLNWAFCDGSLLSISEFGVLFTLIGTTYGGNGQTTFALPDLRSRTPIHFGPDGAGNTYVQGQLGGVENVTLAAAQVGAHTHTLNAVNTGVSAPSPAGALPGLSSSSQTGTMQYGTGASGLTTLTSASIGTNGPAGQSHSNIQPYLAITFIISLFGVFPSQN